MGLAPPEDPCVDQRALQGQRLSRYPLGVHVVFGAQAEAGGVHRFGLGEAPKQLHGTGGRPLTGGCGVFQQV